MLSFLIIFFVRIDRIFQYKTTKKDCVARIRSCLEAAFQPEALEITDDTASHEGHAGAQEGKGHYKIRIISGSFSGMRPIDRHRLVFDALGEMMETDIHAISVTALPTTSATY